MKRIKKIIIDKPAQPEDSIRVFKLSKARVKKIYKLVDEIMEDKLIRASTPS